MTQPRTIEGRQRTSFVESPSRPNNSAREVVVSNTVDVNIVSKFGEYDEIQATYPTTSSENYTYKFESNTIGVVTVTYTDDTKKDLLSVTYNVI